MVMRSNVRLQEITQLIDTFTLDESVQELIRDLKRTQHGDRTNPVYDIISDHHMEGGVWKHTKLALDSLPKAAQALADHLDDPEYMKIYDEFKQHIRAAALFHDIGKISTQQPSKKRPGSYSFPGHTNMDLVNELFDAYDIKTNALVAELVAHHHDVPSDMADLVDDWDDAQFVMLMILKVADNMAVGPRGANDAIKHVHPFLVALQEKGEGEGEGPPLPNEWNVEDIEWAAGSELGFLEPEQEIIGPHVAGEIAGEEGEEVVVGLETFGEREVVVYVSSPVYEGDFTSSLRGIVLKNPEQVVEFVRADVMTFLKEQPHAPEEEQWEGFEEKIDLEILAKKSFELTSETADAIEFPIYVKVSWG